eukprot:979943-Rhodomonas_salina.2
MPLPAYAMLRTETADIAISLRACYAMPSTQIACGASFLRVPYGMSGTDMLPAYARAMQDPVLRSRISLRARYAMSGTELAYQGLERVASRGYKLCHRSPYHGTALRHTHSYHGTALRRACAVLRWVLSQGMVLPGGKYRAERCDGTAHSAQV